VSERMSSAVGRVAPSLLSLLAEDGELAFQPQPLFIGILRIRALLVRWVNTCDHVSEALVMIGGEAGFGRLPDTGRELCSQPTASRRERTVAELSR
jgi:hypothetical protein